MADNPLHNLCTDYMWMHKVDAITLEKRCGVMKKIKQYFALQRKIQIEILETLCSICQYIAFDVNFSRNPHSRCFYSHYDMLKSLSEKLRGMKWLLWLRKKAQSDDFVGVCYRFVEKNIAVLCLVYNGKGLWSLCIWQFY